MADKLPKLFSDAEFNAQLELRERRFERMQRELRPSDGRPESTLEQRFPHVAQKLTAMWWSEACALFLSKLMICDRSNRQGFPHDVLEDLIMLSEINASRINPACFPGIVYGRNQFGWARQRRAVTTNTRRIRAASVPGGRRLASF